MHQEQRQQTRALLKERDIDQAVFAKPESVKWLTGFAAPVQVGPNLFAASYPLVWYDGEHFTLIVVDAFAELAAPFGQEPDGSLVRGQQPRCAYCQRQASLNSIRKHRAHR